MIKEIPNKESIKREKIEARDRALKKLEELKKTTLEAIKKKHKDGNKKCWFDYQKCFYSLEIKGFEDARRECGNCSQLDKERFFNVAENIFGNSEFIEKMEKKAKEDGREEGRNEAKEEAEEEKDVEAANIYDEISEEIDSFWPEIEEVIGTKIE